MFVLTAPLVALGGLLSIAFLDHSAAQHPANGALPVPSTPFQPSPLPTTPTNPNPNPAPESPDSPDPSAADIANALDQAFPAGDYPPGNITEGTSGIGVGGIDGGGFDPSFLYSRFSSTRPPHNPFR